MRFLQDSYRIRFDLLPQLQMSSPHYLAIDFETTYVKDVRDIGSLGVHNYLRHPDTKIWLVSMSDNQGRKFSGKPEDAPWNWITPETTLLSHNRTFDSDVLEQTWVQFNDESLENPRWIPYKDWICTSDTAAANQVPRALKGACKVVLGTKVDKDVRDKMSGKDPATMTKEFWDECVDYAQADADNCLALHEMLTPLSEHEHKASLHTTRMCHRGIGVDEGKLNASIEKIKLSLFELQSSVPWFGELDVKGKEIPTMSPKAVARECSKLGIPAPESMAKDSPEFDRWCEEYSERAPFVQALGKIRSCNRVLTVLEAMKARTSGGRLYYGLKYFGAQHTGRWSGDNGLNMQNLPRKEMFGIDLRSMLIPKPGHVFVSADYSQIEARVLPWIAGNEPLLKLLRDGMDIYEAYARSSLGYTDPRPLKEVNPELRQIGKIHILGLGFGLGAATLVNYAKSNMGLKLTPVEAKRIVNDFRARNQPTVRVWNLLGGEMRRTMIQNRGEDMNVKLPSGRTIKYFNVHEDQGMRASKIQGESPLWWTPGALTENLIQGTARDVLAQAVVRIEEAGIPVVLHVHDEVLCEVPLDDAQEACQTVKRIMEDLPDWCAGLPLNADPKIINCYTK